MSVGNQLFRVVLDVWCHRMAMMFGEPQRQEHLTRSVPFLQYVGFTYTVGRQLTVQQRRCQGCLTVGYGKATVEQQSGGASGPALRKLIGAEVVARVDKWLFSAEAQ